MCRMLAICGYSGIVGELLFKFQELSLYGKSPDGKGHQDGWGIGYFNTGLTVEKKAEYALTSEKYMQAVDVATQSHCRLLLAHLRKASPGTLKSDEETHPFQSDRLLFCHNGSITQKDGTSLGGELDSILFFRKIQEDSLIEAIEYFGDFVYTSLTCLLTDGHTLWAYRDFREREDYYTLYYLKREDFIIFCSEPIFPGKWVLMGNCELATVAQPPEIMRESLAC